MRVLRTWGGGAALRRHEAVTLNLIRELLERGGLKSREDQRCFDRLQSSARRQASARGSFGGESELLCRSLKRHGLRRRIQNILNWSNTRDGFLGEDADLQGEGAGELAIEINRTAAHAGRDPGVFDLGALELNQQDGFLWADGVGQQ